MKNKNVIPTGFKYVGDILCMCIQHAQMDNYIVHFMLYKYLLRQLNYNVTLVLKTLKIHLANDK